MKIQKFQTKFPNVRYYEHSTRKMRNGQADKYYSIRHQYKGRTIEEGLGWASGGWSAQKANTVLAQIRENKRLGTGPQSLAEMRQAKLEQQEIARQAAEMEQASNITLSTFFSHYYIPHTMRTKRSWLHDKRRYYRVLDPALGHLPMRSITHEHIQKLLNSLTDAQLSPSTVKQYRSILSQIFNLASRTMLHEHYIFVGTNPIVNVITPPIKNERQRFLTGEEAELLISTAKTLPSQDLHDCIVLSLNTGLRLGELQRLQWIDIDMNNRMLTVRDEAHRKPGGKVPLNDHAMSVFDSRQHKRTYRPMGLIFPPKYGGNFRDTLSKSFRALTDSLNLNEGLSPQDRQHRIVFHTLRHTFASWLAIGGTDIFKIKTLMRHKTIGMTMRYAHLIPSATRDAVNNLKPPKAR